MPKLIRSGRKTFSLFLILGLRIWILPLQKKATKVEMLSSGILRIFNDNKSKAADYELNLKPLSIELEDKFEENKVVYNKKLKTSEFLEKKFDNEAELRNLREFSLEENNCLLLRQYMESMPFNLDIAVDSFFFKKIRDEFKPISYRTMGLKLLKEQTIFDEETNREIQRNIGKIRGYKQKLLGLLGDEKDDYFLLREQNADIIDNAMGILKGIENKKLTIMEEFSSAIDKLHRLRASLWKLRDDLLKQDPFLETKVAVSKYLENLELIIQMCQGQKCIESIDHDLIEKVNLQGIKQEVDDFLVPLNIRQQLLVLEGSLVSEQNLIHLNEKHESREEEKSPLPDGQGQSEVEASEFSTVDHGKLDDLILTNILSDNEVIEEPSSRSSLNILSKINIFKSEAPQTSPSKSPQELIRISSNRSAVDLEGSTEQQQLEVLIKNVREEIQKLDVTIREQKKQLLTKISNLKKALQGQINSDGYFQFLRFMNLFKTQSTILLNSHFKVVKMNLRGQNYAFLVAQLSSEPELDIILPYEIRDALEKELREIKTRVRAIKQINEDIAKTSVVKRKKMISALTGGVMQLRFEKQQKLIEILKEREKLIRKIKDLEEYFDSKLGDLFGRVNQFGQPVPGSERVKNHMKCFSEIEMGRNMFMMSKSNVIINQKTFSEAFLAHHSFAQMRNFVLLNYAVFVNEEYLDYMHKEYKIRHFFKGEEKFMRQKLLSEFVNRFTFLIGLYKQKVDSTESAFDQNFIRRQCLFIQNGFGLLKSQLKGINSDVLVDVVKEKLIEYFVSVIPFISQVPFLKNFTQVVIARLLNAVVGMMTEFFNLHEMQIRLVVSNILSVVKPFLVRQENQSLDLWRFFDEYSWTNSLNSIHWGDDEFFLIKRDLDSADLENGKEVFKLMDIKSIDQKYREFLTLDDKSSDPLFMFVYSKKINSFTPEGYLLGMNRLRVCPNLMDKFLEEYDIHFEYKPPTPKTMELI